MLSAAQKLRYSARLKEGADMGKKIPPSVSKYMAEIGKRGGQKKKLDSEKAREMARQSWINRRKKKDS